MKLLITYKNGKTETHIGIEQIIPVKSSDGKSNDILLEGFNWFFRLEKPRETENRGIKSMELLF